MWQVELEAQWSLAVPGMGWSAHTYKVMNVDPTP